MPMSVIQPILSRLLNINTKANRDHVFIHRRLCLHDRRYCFDLHRNLWQSYLDMGTQSSIWPVSILAANQHFLLRISIESSP